MTHQTIGRYEIRKELGRGGMATVYHAYDPRFSREVALKVLPAAFLHDPQFRTRFEREAQTIANLEHPAIVPVYDFGEGDGWLYLVMRLMNGGTLAKRLEKGPIPVVEAARIFGRLAPALDTVHQRGIVHRDLKPTNILFDEWDNPYLSDFGIAKLVAGSRTALTASGGLIGTAEYMSPEQVQAKVTLDGRSDIYSLGVILFEMLSGQVPFQADTPMGTAVMHLQDAVPNISEVNLTLPSACGQVIERAMAKERDDRYPTAEALARAVVKLTTKTEIELPRATGLPSGERPPMEEPLIIVPSPQPDKKESIGARADRPTSRPEERADSALSPADGRRRLQDSQSQGRPLQKKRSISGYTWISCGVLAIFTSILALALIVVLMTPLPGPGDDEPTERPTIVSRTPTATIAQLPADTATSTQIASIPQMPTETATPTQLALNTEIPTDTATPTHTPMPDQPVLERILVETLEGHAESVYSLAFSPDETILASGSTDEMVRLWQVSDGTLLNTLVGHTHDVWSVAFSPDGRTLVSGAWDNRLRLWRVSDGQPLYILQGHLGPVYSVAFSPDGTTLASGSSDDTVRLWGASNGQLLNTLEGHSGTVLSVAFSADGTILASGSDDNTIRLWRVSDGQPLATMVGHTDDVNSVAFSRNGTTLASGSTDTTVRVWRVNDGRLLYTLEGHTYAVRSVAFSLDGTTLASGSFDNTVRLWRVSNGDLLGTLAGNNSFFFSIAFSTDLMTQASGSNNGPIIIWRIIGE